MLPPSQLLPLRHSDICKKNGTVIRRLGTVEKPHGACGRVEKDVGRGQRRCFYTGGL